MSNQKHLADLLKVCSILPALAIMPAMAEVKTEVGSLDKPVDYVTNTKTDEMGRDGHPMGLIRVLNMTEGTFSHDLDTNAMTISPSENGKITAQNLFVGIQSKTDADVVPSIVVKGDKNTVLTLTSDKDGVYPLVSRFAGLNIGTEDAPLGEVSLVHAGAAEGGNTAIYVTGGNSNVHADSQELNIYANKVSIKSNAIAITGNEGRLDLVANDTLDIVGNIYGYNKVYGGKSNLVFNINQNEGNTAKTTVVGDINAAKGSEVNIGLKGTGSSITGNMLVSAEGTTLPGGLINLGFGDEGTITGNITAQDLGKVKITAGDDFDIKGNVYATTEGSAVDVQAKDIEIWAENGQAVYADNGATVTVGDANTDEIEIIADNGFAAASVRPGSSMTIQGTDIELSASKDGAHAAAYAFDSASLSIATADTENVKMSAEYIAAWALKSEAKLDINGKNIEIVNDAAGNGTIHAQNNTVEEGYDYTKSATVNINGDNVVIKNAASDGIAVSAMSQGVVNIAGNATISADNAILARGMAKVNVNTSGEDVVKMLGDIAFDYDAATSGTAIDALVDVTLAGAESFWTGNTVVSYNTGKPADEALLDVNSVKLTMKDGAVWNATAIVDNKADVKGRYYTALNDLIINNGTVNIADTERGILVDRIVANDATFNGGMLNVNETIDITSGTTVFNSAVLGDAGVLNLAEGATLNIGTSTVDLAKLNINGTVLASVLSERSYGSLNGAIVAGENGKVQLNVGSVGSYKIFGSQADIDITAGAAYDVSQEADGTVVIATKAIEDIATDAGISTQAAGAIAGLANADSGKAHQVSLALQEALNSGDAAFVETETKKLNPTDKPVAQAAATSIQNQVLALTSGRMAGGISVGRAGGDAVAQENGFWMQGLFNKSKFADAFHGYTRGIALGADTLIDKTWTIGGGLAFNNSDVHADGVHTDIDSKTLFLYGQYKPNKWYVNGTLTYNMSEYTENKTAAGVSAEHEYDVDSYGAQVMTGYDFATGITTEAGLRYLHVAQDGYSDGFGLTSVKALDTDFLSGVAGMKYAFAIENDWAIQLRPELRAAMTYDFISDDAMATVIMPNVASYQVAGERLSRLGGEFGIGLTALYKGMEFSVMYDLDLHKDYTSQTGMIKFRTQF